MLDLQNLEISFAMEVVTQAARLVELVQREMVSSALTKEDRSPVTIADFASQALVASRLADQFPAAVLVGEESAQALRSPAEAEKLDQVTAFVHEFVPQATPEKVCDWIDRGSAAPGTRFWTLDPIDGTKGFLRGDQYAVALALVSAGQVQIGALGCPNLSIDGQPDFDGPGSLLVAARGEGAWMLPLDGQGTARRLAVSDRNDPAQARLMRSFEAGHTNVSQIDEFAAALGIQAEPVRMDSQAKYAVLAAGGGELILRLLSPKAPDYKEKIWDQAAGALIVEEAGGRVSDLHGKALDFTAGRTLKHNRGILVSNGWLHEPALAALRQIRA
ncbi:MAG: 3'(2'),5'-bisphosphate nucleotidase [Anaerolineales bacterium]